MHCSFPFGRFPSPPAGNGVRAAASSLSRAGATFPSPAVPFTPEDGEAELHAIGGGEFEGYASVFGIMDLGHDVVMPGAFRDTLAERGPRGVKLLWQHDPGEPIGHWLRIEEDSHGLFVRGRLDLDSGRARAAHAMLRKGALDGLSIGYRTTAERRDRTTGLRMLERVDLWEISLVTFPLLPQARVRSVKSAAIRMT